MPLLRAVAGWTALVGPLMVACQPSRPSSGGGDELFGVPGRLPTGRALDPAGRSTPVGSFPLALVMAPGGDKIVLLLNGYRDQGVQVVDRATGAVTQTLVQPAAFLGLAFSPDGRTFYASGGNQDVVYHYDWSGGEGRLRDSVVLATRITERSGTRYPAGLALSVDGRFLYVAENLGDSLAVVNRGTGAVAQRVPSGRYPYGVVVAPDGLVYVSAWGEAVVTVYRPGPGGWLSIDGVLEAGRHPSGLLLTPAGDRLFVASASTDRVTVFDTRTRRAVAVLEDSPPAGPREGSTPNALALSGDGSRLFVAEADNNAVAVFDLSAETSGVEGARGGDRLVGRIPVEWYPTALAVSGDTLVVANGKGRGTGPNDATGPGPSRPTARDPRGYTLGQLSGTVSVVPGALTPASGFQSLSQRVAHANGWDRPRGRGGYPPFEHVIYVIKENRTYDQVFGDMRDGDGDSSLVFFPRSVSPNHHALADRFGLFDRFFVNAEVSPDGHNWSTAGYTTDYLQKTVPSNYSSRGRSYDYEGTNRGSRPDDDDDVAAPAGGYLWNLAQQKGITFRNFGEYVEREGTAGDAGAYVGLKPYLEEHTDPRFPGYDLRISDQARADVWLEALAGYERDGRMPALQIVRLPNDHTMGARAGELSPRAYMADNDLALGRMIEGLSGSRFWANTVVFVLEDDAQNGPDHVDSHRSVLLVLSPYNRSGVVHRFVNTTDVLATIEEILGLGTLSQFDHFGRPLAGLFATTPDLSPFQVLRPGIPLTDRNPMAGGPGEGESRNLDFSEEDRAEEDAFNRSLWRSIKGPGVPYPGITRMSTLEWRRWR